MYVKMLKVFYLVLDYVFIKKLLCKKNVEMSKSDNMCQKSIYNIFVEK